MFCCFPKTSHLHRRKRCCHYEYELIAIQFHLEGKLVMTLPYNIYIYTTYEKKKNSSYGKTTPDIKFKELFYGGRKVPQKTLVTYNVPGFGS